MKTYLIQDDYSPAWEATASSKKRALRHAAAVRKPRIYRVTESGMEYIPITIGKRGGKSL